MKQALLLIDIQNDYFDGGTMTLVNARTASRQAKLLLEAFRNKHLPVIHIQHIAIRPTATFFLPDTFGANIHEDVQPLQGEKVVIKHFPNSFRETELLDVLREYEITHLTVAGMMTHMCIDATTRAATDLGYVCTLVGDACATRNLEINGETVKAADVHNAFLAALNVTYATVSTTKEQIQSLQ